MNIKHLVVLSLGLILPLFILQSCDKDTTVNYTAPSNDAQIYAFSFSAIAPISKDSAKRAQDSIRFIQVNKTKFAIDQLGEVIYNPDSLPFGTVLNKVKAELTFNQNWGVSKVEVYTPDSVKGYSWNKTDSLDFSKQPISFRVTPVGSEGGAKNYKLDIRIHKVDPDTIVWTKMQNMPLAGASKTLLRKGEFYSYVLNNGAISLFKADQNLSAWTKTDVSGMPSNIQLQSLIISDEKFYGIDNAGKSYASLDGKTWTSPNNGTNIKSILGVLPISAGSEVLLVVVEKDSKYYFGKSTNLVSVETISSIAGIIGNNQIPANFPIKDAGACTSYSENKATRMLILTGGIDVDAKNVASSWLVKYNSNNEIEISKFLKYSAFAESVGISSFNYNSRLYALANNKLYTSVLWGEKWEEAPTKQKLNSAISPRSGQSVIVDDKNYIWIFGGVSKTGTFPADVWKGRLNKLASK